MARITRNLFEAIQSVTSGEVVENSVDKAHFCATHVEHALLGYGECISEQHADPDEEGNISWYTVKFPTGTHKIETNQLRVVEGKSHTHSKKMAEDTEAIEEAEGGIPKTDRHKKLAAHYGDPNRITRGDVITAAKKNAMKEEEIKEAAKKDMSAFDWKSKAKQSESKFDKKKISTGTVYTKKAPKEKEDKDMKESKTQTVINHHDFVLEVTDNPTFKDYLSAIQSMVPTNDTNVQKEIVTIATEAYNENYVDIIYESILREGFEGKFDEMSKQGYKISDINYVVEEDGVYVEYTAEKNGVATQHVHTGEIEHDTIEEQESDLSKEYVSAAKKRAKDQQDEVDAAPAGTGITKDGKIFYKNADKVDQRSSVDDQGRLQYKRTDNTPQYSSVDDKGRLQYKGPTAGAQQSSVDDKGRIVFRK
jgi:hypothetical protein